VNLNGKQMLGLLASSILPAEETFLLKSSSFLEICKKWTSENLSSHFSSFELGAFKIKPKKIVSSCNNKRNLFHAKFSRKINKKNMRYFPVNLFYDSSKRKKFIIIRAPPIGTEAQWRYQHARVYATSVNKKRVSMFNDYVS
jgi:hypothetical protein